MGWGCRRWTHAVGSGLGGSEPPVDPLGERRAEPEATCGPVAGLFPPPTSQLDAFFEACFAKCCTGHHLRGHLCWQRQVPGHPLPTHLPRRCAQKPCPGLDPEPLPGAGTALGPGAPMTPPSSPFTSPSSLGRLPQHTEHTVSTHTTRSAP